MKNKIFGILANETSDGHKYWVTACEKQGISPKIIRATSFHWLNEINNSKIDIILTCPPGTVSHIKQLYDEKLFILNKILEYPCYPSYDEVLIYENKRMLSYWLMANGLPCPKTHVIYEKEEAFDFIKNVTHPVVAKMNIGASGRGVSILKDRESSYKYIKRAFSLTGIASKSGPNLKMGMWSQRILNVLRNPDRIIKRLQLYKTISNDTQKFFVIFQQYIPHDFEWRIVKIGDSYFGHKKIKVGDKASGSKGIDYSLPPEMLLSFVKDICLRFNFNTMAVDIFEDEHGGYLINEMQTIFGHVQSYICRNDDGPGRFLFKDGKWIFENGMFNTNLSYDLRLNDVITKMI